MNTKRTKNKPKKTNEDRIRTLEKSMASIENKLVYITSSIDSINNAINRVGTADDPDLCAPDYPPTREGAIQEILAEFDFAKMSRVMEFLDWKWYNLDRIPTVGDLRNEAKDQLERAFKYLDDKKYDKYGWRENNTGTGGFDIWVCEHKDGRIFAHLKFVVEDWRVEPLNGNDDDDDED